MEEDNFMKLLREYIVYVSALNIGITALFCFLLQEIKLLNSGIFNVL